MPNFVHTKSDEKRWSAAKKAAAKTKGKAVSDLKDHDFALANYIYHKMGKTEEDMKMAEEFKSQLMLKPIKAMSLTNPMKTGITSVKTPKAKKMPDPFGKPSLMVGTIGKSEKIKHPSLEKLRVFLEKVRSKR